MLTLARKRLKVSTTFGIILTAGGASNGLIRKSTKAVTGLFLLSPNIGPVLIGILAVTTKDIRKRRINRNGHVEKRKILQK